MTFFLFFAPKDLSVVKKVCYGGSSSSVLRDDKG